MERRLAVLMAIDEPYAAPLFVTVTSLLHHLSPAVGVDLHVMESGLTPETRRTLERSWGDRVRLSWVSLDLRKLDVLRRHGYMVSPAANFRLTAGSSLPGVSKVIYLDADLLIRRDIVGLWDQDMQGKVVLAVQDAYIQRLPAQCLPGQDGTGGRRPYFNSGVMVIDLDAWRAAGLEEACLEAARRLQHQVRWLDQHVLNACLAGRWGSLPPVWNKQFALDLFPDWRCSPYGEKEFQEARSHPAIVHFCTRTKPWQAFCDHPRQEVLAYRATLESTAFAGALEGTPSLLRRTSEVLARPHRRLLDTTATALGAGRRAHALRAMLPHMVRLAMRHPWTLVSVPVSVVRDRVARLGHAKLRLSA